MSRVDEAERKLMAELFGFTEGHRLEQPNAVFGLLESVKWQRRIMLGRAFLVVEARLFFLQVSGIRQDDRA